MSRDDEAHLAREATSLAAEATKKKFANRLASEDQRNGYEVGYYDALMRVKEAIIFLVKG